ncbi:MAG TPA: sigma 54-interacting transcriptional regulator [Tenuifilaceae bacterium]|nr:sigma 54-interacting transcriptional regulator [Tenuifilaceae bacterium]
MSTITIDKSDIGKAKSLTPDELKWHLKQNKEFLEVAKKHIDLSAKYFDNQEFVFFVFCPNGYVLYSVSHRSTNKMLEELSISLGYHPHKKSILHKSINEVYGNGFTFGSCRGQFISTSDNLEWECLSVPVKHCSETIGAVSICYTIKGNNHGYKPLLFSIAKGIEQELDLAKKHAATQKVLKKHFALLNHNEQTNVILSQSGQIEFISNETLQTFGFAGNGTTHENIKSIIPEWRKIASQITTTGNYAKFDIHLNTIPKPGYFRLNVTNIGKEPYSFLLTFTPLAKALAFTNQHTNKNISTSFNDIIAISPITKRLVRKAKKIAHGKSHVLISGEAACGKETFAKAIHNASNRQLHGLTIANLNGLTEAQIEEELWGFSSNYRPPLKRGECAGAFEKSNGGTLLIKSIELLPLSQQKMLLNTLRSSITSRKGCNNATFVDIRLIATTSANLQQMVKDGTFSAELLSVFTNFSIHIPPLRERRADVLPLFDHILTLQANELKLKIPSIPRKILLILRRYEWPENANEMKEFAKRVLLNKGEMFAKFKNERQFKQMHLNLAKQRVIERIKPLDVIEKEMVEKAFYALDGSISKTARKLGVSRNTLYLKLNKYGIIETN